MCDPYDAPTSAATGFAGDGSRAQGSRGQPPTRLEPEAVRDLIAARISKPVGPLPGTIDSTSFRQAVVDHLYNRFPVPPAWQEAAPILVYSRERQGLGDILFGAKSAGLLRQALPLAELHWCVQFTRPEDAQRNRAALSDVANEYGVRATALVASDERSTPPFAKPPRVVVVGPGGSNDEYSSPICRIDPKGELPRILLPEYSRESFAVDVPPAWRVIRTGAGPAECGLLLDSRLMSGEALPLSAYNTKLHDHLGESPYLFAYVNGVQCPDSHRLVYESWLRLKEYWELEAMSLVFAGNYAELAKNKEWTFKPKDPVVNLDSAEVKPDAKKTAGIYFQTMTHRQFLAALKNSFPIRFVTGDQSLSEALSLADSRIYYEAISHKLKLSRDLAKRRCEKFIDQFNTLNEDTAGWMKLIVGEAAPIRERQPNAWVREVQATLDLRARLVGAVSGFYLRAGAQDIASAEATFASSGLSEASIDGFAKNVDTALGAAR
jgi:hypothetical protein